jgi:HEAT repeats
MSIEKRRSIEFFIKCLSDQEPQIREKAVTILGNFGAEEAIPALEALIENTDEDIQLRLRAMDAIASIHQFITIMAEQSKNQPAFNIGQVGNINTGDVNIQRDQVGIQNNYDADTEIQKAIDEIQLVLVSMQNQYPQANESEAIEIIDAEFQDQQRPQWQKLLSLKRLYKGSKKAAIKIGEHFTESNIWGKGLIAFLEGISE